MLKILGPHETMYLAPQRDYSLDLMFGVNLMSLGLKDSHLIWYYGREPVIAIVMESMDAEMNLLMRPKMGAFALHREVLWQMTR
jgi:hypothetical protein